MLTVDVSTKDGDQTLSVQDIMAQLNEAGYGAKAVSPDGLNITMEDDQGDYTLPIHQVLQNVGAKVKSIKPDQADDSGINALWAYGISSLPEDDDVRKAYLTSKLQKEAGVANPNVIGSGEDWFYFNPQTQKYMSLTSGNITSKIASLAPTAMKIAGSTVGGVAGAIGGGLTSAGIGTVPGGALGAVAGGQGGSLLNRTIAGILDPEISQKTADYYGNDYGKMLKDKAPDMVFDAVGGLIPAAVPKAFAHGIGSKVMKAGGAVSKYVGGGIQTVAGALDNTFGRTVARMPVTDGLEAATMLARAPDWLTRNIPEGISKLGQKASEIANKSWVKGEQPNWLVQKAMDLGAKVDGIDLMKPRLGVLDDAVLQKAQNAAGKIANPSFVPQTPPTGTRARDILGNLGEALGSKSNPKGFMKPGEIYSADEAVRLGEEALLKNTVRGGRIGETIGHGIDTLTKASRGIDKGLDASTRFALGGAKQVGRTMKAAGQKSQILGTLAEPWENRAILQTGMEAMNGTPDAVKEYFRQRQKSRIYGGQE